MASEATTSFSAGVPPHLAGSMPRSRIIGLDIHEKRADLGRRVRVVQADQNDPADLRRILVAHGVPNIVIDDGSHVGAHVRTSFDTIFPLLRRGSIYVIEDMHTSYWPDYGGAPTTPADSAIGLVRGLSTRHKRSTRPSSGLRVNRDRSRRTTEWLRSRCIPASRS